MTKTPTLDSIQEELDKLKGQLTVMTEPEDMPYVLVRTFSAGVHIGFLSHVDRATQTVELVQSRRIYQWAGAFTVSAIAKFGTKKPDDCLLSVEVDEIMLLDAIEVIPTTEVAKHILRGMEAHDPT